VGRLFTSGFEVANDSAGHEWTNAGVSGAGRATSNMRTGTGCGQTTGLVSATQAGWGVQFVGTADGGPYYARAYLRIDTAPSADNCILAFISGANVTSTSTNDAQIRLSSTRTLKLFANNSQVGSASAALSTGTYYMLELEVDNTPGAGSKIVRAYLDGSQFAGTTASSDVGGNISGIALGGNLNAEAQTQGDWRWDDVAVNDSTGGSQNGRVPAGQVIVLRPNAAGDSNQFNNTANGAGSSNNYQLVDETDPDDATTMVQSGTLNNLDLYNLDASGIGASDTVNAVHVHLRRRNNTADATTAVNVIVVKTSGGTQASGTAVIPNSTTWRTGSTTSSTHIAPNYTAYTDPDGAAWTQSTLDTMQAGPKVTAANVNRVQVSAVWVTVDYTPVTSVDATATPAAIACVAALPAATAAAGSTLTPAAITATVAAPQATLVAGSTPTPAPAAAVAALPTAAVWMHLHALVDNFDDNAIDTTLWPGNYGGVAESGGRFVIDCDSGQWSGLKSATRYTLDETSVSLRAYPAAANTATVAYLSTLVTTTTPGTDAGFNVDTASNGIAFLSRVGFSDAEAVFDTYSATDHAWLRLREASGTLHWETSADGQTWTSRRTAASPAWVADTTLALLVESHRDAGTDNTAEVDNVNVIPATATPAVIPAVVAAPQAVAGAAVLATPDPVAALAALPAVTATAGSTPTPAAIATVAALPAADVSVGSTTVPAAIAATTTLPAASPTAGSTATPAAVAATAGAAQAALSASSTPAADLVAALAALPAAAAGASANVAPDPAAVAVSLPLALPIGGGSAAVAPATVTVTVAVALVRIRGGIPAISTPTVAAAVASSATAADRYTSVSSVAGNTSSPAVTAGRTSAGTVSASATSSPTVG
jgi:hypothetical protein